MKTIFRSLSFGIALVAVVAASGLSTLGQVTAATPSTPCTDSAAFEALYGKFTPTIGSEMKAGKEVSIFLPKTTEEKQAALNTAKEIIEKYGSCPKPATPEAGVDYTANVTYVRSWIPIIEANIKAQESGKTFGRFDQGIQGEKYDEAFATGKEILVKQPDNLNILLPLGLIGLYQSYANNFKYNDDSMRYAQQALAILKSGKALPKKNAAGEPSAGAFRFERTKDEAISELTYALAHMNYYGKKDKKAALPYYYEVAQLNGRFKTEPGTYSAIGNYYLDDAAKIGQEVAALIAKQKAAPTVAEKEAIDKEIEPKAAMFNAYNERIIDAFARAYTVAKSDTPANKTYRDGLYKTLQEAYRRRFDKLDGLDAYVASTVAKPLPNPTTPITPVATPAPAATTPVSAAPVTATPAAPVAVKPAAITAKTTAPVTAKPVAPAAKTPVKTPIVAKKKGTR